MKMKKGILSICTLLAATASIAGAQQRQLPAELGMDAGVSIGFDTPRVTTISLPVPAVRLGFYMSDRVSLEPKFGFLSYHDGTGTSSAYSAELGLLYHFENNPVGRGIYARPFVGFLGSKNPGTSDTQTLFGAGIGLKEPFANRFASRLEVNYSHVTAPTGGSATSALGILFGISVFSR